MQSTINIKQYISVVSELVFRACLIAKQCAQNPNLKKYQKKVNDPVTQADFKIQTMLTRGLRHFFPTINIVGQQNIEYTGQIVLDLNSIKIDTCPDKIQDQQIPLQQVCVWIDPIDNTKGFINGTYDCVTILVGLSRNQKSYVGVVGLPYLKSSQTPVFKPQLLVGHASQKLAFSVFDGNQWTLLKTPIIEKRLRFARNSSRRHDNIYQQISKKYNAQTLNVGGSGKKIAMVIKGQADALLYISSSNHKWDTCAGQAIVHALGGYFSDIHGNSLVYDPKANTINLYGNVCIFNKVQFELFIEDISVFSKQKQ